MEWVLPHPNLPFMFWVTPLWKLRVEYLSKREMPFVLPPEGPEDK